MPAPPARRWIVDGIDGTHNYGDGRPGWGTIVAYEADGDIVVGLVSAPRFGRRWWAVRGRGSMVGALPAGRLARPWQAPACAAPRRPTCPRRRSS